MPLMECNLNNKYQLTFWTISGFTVTPPGIFRDHLLHHFKQLFPSYREVVVAYEVSTDGFKHYHVGIETHYPGRICKAVKETRKLMNSRHSNNGFDCLPLHEFVDTKSIQVNACAVPLGGERGSDGVHRVGMHLVRTYLTNPTKEKEVDGRLVIEQDDETEWNIYRYIPTLSSDSAKKQAQKIADWWKAHAPPEAGPLTFRD